MTKYKIIFKDGRVGREKQGPFEVEAGNADQLAEKVFDEVAPKLLSSVVDVIVDQDKGYVLVGGYRTVGEFHATEI